MPKSYIAVAGNMGCGKSTLVNFLCQRHGLTPFFEPNEANPYLADFYGDMATWGFHSQLYFLTHKFRIHQELEAAPAHDAVIQDRTIYEDAEVFAAALHQQGHLSDRDWETYHQMYRNICRSLRPPDLMIYLRATTQTLRKRITLRGRPEEQAIPTAYLRTLNELYESWLENYDRSPVLVIDINNFDYIQDLEHRIELRRLLGLTSSANEAGSTRRSRVAQRTIRATCGGSDTSHSTAAG